MRITPSQAIAGHLLYSLTGHVAAAAFRLSSCVLAMSLAFACSSSPRRVSPPQQLPSANPGLSSAAHQPPDGARNQPFLDSALRKRGYQPALYRGERVYCRNETITGSNLETKVCLTAAQIEDQERSGKDMLAGPHPDGCGPETKGCM
jgi:hypothetical protein